MSLKMNLTSKESTLNMNMDENGGSVILSKDYERLYNKPKIAGIELTGNKNLDELGMEKLSNTDIYELIGREING